MFSVKYPPPHFQVQNKPFSLLSTENIKKKTFPMKQKSEAEKS